MVPKPTADLGAGLEGTEPLEYRMLLLLVAAVAASLDETCRSALDPRNRVQNSATEGRRSGMQDSTSKQGTVRVYSKTRAAALSTGRGLRGEGEDGTCLLQLRAGAHSCHLQPVELHKKSKSQRGPGAAPPHANRFAQENCFCR